MMSFGPVRRVVKEPKLDKDRTQVRQTRGESFREAQTRARYTSYTEKSLLVVKDFVFMEKDQNKSATRGESFHGIPDGVNVPRYMWDTTQSLARRESTKKRKPKTWLPNGGGIKPYFASDAQKPLAPEDCIVNMKAVKPKVDTWFRQKRKRSKSPENQKNSKGNGPNCRQGHPRSPPRAATVVPSLKRPNVESAETTRVAGNKCASGAKGDSAVKSLTSYWNDHLKRQPFTMTQPQKSFLNGRGDSFRKEPDPHVLLGRPKSVGSDGVVLEHTLVPSQVLADRKMSSVEDIITFVKKTSTAKAKREKSRDTKQMLGSAPPESEPLEQALAICEIESAPAPAPPPSPKALSTNTPSSHDYSKMSNDTYRRSNDHSRKSRLPHHRPLFVIRLHTRWMLAFKVLTLTFKPLVEAWKRRWRNSQAQDGVMKLSTQKYEVCQGDVAETPSRMPAYSKNPYKSHKLCSKRRNPRSSKSFSTLSETSCSSKIEKIENLKRRCVPSSTKPSTRRNTFTIEDFSKNPGIATEQTTKGRGSKFLPCLNHTADRVPLPPLVTEPVSSSGQLVIYDEAKSSTAKSASLEVLPHGFRMSLYVEYHLLISFFGVQLTLLLIALFIKCLQEYTA